MTNQTSDKGLAGERQALAYLQQLGMRPVCQRYRCPYGEIDLVMLDGDCLVFVEVKLRARGRKNDGVSAVTMSKQRRLIRAARSYLGQHPTELPVRFDIVEITGEGVFHLPNAFEGSEW